MKWEADSLGWHLYSSWGNRKSPRKLCSLIGRKQETEKVAWDLCQIGQLSWSKYRMKNFKETRGDLIHRRYAENVFVLSIIKLKITNQQITNYFHFDRHKWGFGLFWYLLPEVKRVKIPHIILFDLPGKSWVSSHSLTQKKLTVTIQNFVIC